MKVLQSITLTDAILTSTNVAEADYAEWNGVDTYAIGDKRIVLSNHTIYQSLQNSNTNHNPLDDIQDDPDNLPVWWVKLNATNRWRPFDGRRDNQVTNADSIQYVITPTVQVDGIALQNITANDANVTVLFDSVEVYNEDFTLTTRAVGDWYEFFFKPFQEKKNIFIDGLPPLIGAQITVTLTQTGGMAGLGILAIGNSLYLGQALYGAVSDMRSYSRTDTNEFGVTSFVRRPNKLLTKQTVVAEKSLTTFLYELRQSLDGVPSVWSTLDDGDDDYFNAYVLNGVADTFKINASNPEQITLELELRET
jgi:hypothetical protein